MSNFPSPSSSFTKGGRKRRRIKVLVLLSGGLDSAVALWWAKKKNWRIATLTFSFPGRRKMENSSCKKLILASGCRENYKFFLPFVSAPQVSQSCYIPKRNLIFYSIASSLAEKIKADFVVGAHHALDGKVFPDAREKYLKQLNALVAVNPVESRLGRGGKATFHRVKLLFPFIRMTKEAVLKMGEQFHLPFEYTWSCSRNGKKHCWKCNSCKERWEGFYKAGVVDPLWNA